MSAPSSWICCQLGAREHYAVPRALHRLGRLSTLITDAWTPRRSPLRFLPGRLPRRLAERFHPELGLANVRGLTWSLLAQEVSWRIQRRSGWNLTMTRNQWFQDAAVLAITEHPHDAGRRTTVFAHSYSARAIFEAARLRGWRTVLGQIDPGEGHFAIARRLEDLSPEFGPPREAPPIRYFESWRHECALADHILVNSTWSRETVVKAGVPEAKVRVVPLAFEGGGEPPARRWPDAFSPRRPLRLLFVGSASVVKGAPELLEAMQLLHGAPVVLTMVGEPGMIVPARFREHPSIRWVGAVLRGDVDRYYQTHDLLVFPSHSDGFGMAQIEAQGWGLPIVASRSCGNVVRDGVNGLLLPEVRALDIAAAVQAVLDRPARLAEFSARAVTGASGFAALATALAELDDA